MSSQAVNSTVSSPQNSTTQFKNSAKPSDVERAHKRKVDIIIAIIILVVGLIVIIIVAILGFRERSLYNECNNNESPYCFQFACESIGDRCKSNAIRWSKDKKSYSCSDAPATWYDLNGNII
jgi:hypothetical protein